MEAELNCLFTKMKCILQNNTDKEQTKQIIDELNKLLAETSNKLAKFSEINNDKEKLEKYYQELSNKNKEIQDLNLKYKKSLIKKKIINFNNDVDEETNLLNSSPSSNVELILQSNYKEKLINDISQNLEETNQNLKESSKIISKQGGTLSEVNKIIKNDVIYTKNGENILKELNCSILCKKTILVIINILLFLLIFNNFSYSLFSF